MAAYVPEDKKFELRPVPARAGQVKHASALLAAIAPVLSQLWTPPRDVPTQETMLTSCCRSAGRPRNLGGTPFSTIP